LNFIPFFFYLSFSNYLCSDDIFNDISTKSSSAAKPKPTNGKTKPAKNFDDLFGDPLNPSSK
jgi:hypothetical protein